MTTSTMFVGEDSALFNPWLAQDAHKYYPTTWKDWTPGAEERFKWAWKYYVTHAQTVEPKSVVGLAKYAAGAAVAFWFKDNPWSNDLWKRKILYALYRDYVRDLESARTLRFNWKLI